MNPLSDAFFEKSPPLSIEDLKQKWEKSSPPKASWEPIYKAYLMSKKAHEGQKRLSGEDYITHPLHVAGILADLSLDKESLMAGLLHDVVEDSSIELKDIEREFGPTIAFLLDGLTKISQIKFQSASHKQSANIRKMIVAMGRDARVILIKLADRLHNLRTLRYMPKAKQKSIAEETLQVYTPLASRLGMNEIKMEMEDWAFRFSLPDQFAQLSQKMKDIYKDKNQYIKQVARILEDTLKANKICDFDVKGRYKNLYSIYRKMKDQDIPFEEIYDITAFRICVRHAHECYKALGLVHNLWKPIPGRFKDFIAMPKLNRYQSLHTTALGDSGRWIEIQIRTHEMHITAEKGVAAHWLYKLQGQKAESQKILLAQEDWMRDLVSQEQATDDSSEFLKNVKMALFDSEIYVLTPEGEIKELPRNATPVDFAYAVHTQIGEKTTGAKVNGSQVPLNHKLKSGDRVEIITSPKQKPSKDWLKICVTSKARSNIRNFFKSNERKKSLEIGEKLFEKGCFRFKISKKDVVSHPGFADYLKSKGFNKKEDLLVDLGFGKINFKQILEHLRKSHKEDHPVSELKLQPHKEQRKSAESPSPLRIEGADNIMVHFAKCCHPLAGDPVKAYVSRKKGIIVHRAVCKALEQIAPERFIEVDWKSEQSPSPDYILSLKAVCADKPGTLSQLGEAFNFFNLNIINLRVIHPGSLKVFVVFDTKVKGLRQAEQLIARLSQIENVLSVKRKTDFD